MSINMPKIKICVLGAGIMGLSSALNILDKISDITVDIIAEKFSPDTTTDVAAGYWDPHAVQDANDMYLAEATFDYMTQLTSLEAAASLGVHLSASYGLSKKPFQMPKMQRSAPGFREMSKSELRTFPGFSLGYAWTSVILDTTKYLAWLRHRCEQKGVKFIKRKIASIKELANDYDLIVNCAGLGALALTDDNQIKPVRGQMIRVAAPWIKTTVFDWDNNVYIIVRGDHVFLGGTYDVNDYDTEINIQTRQNILEKCAKIYPSLKHAKFLRDLVGLRPTRPKVRLETVNMLTDHKILPVIHNYGHSGAGVTLHWGSALKATSLVQEAVHRIKNQSKL